MMKCHVLVVMLIIIGAVGENEAICSKGDSVSAMRAGYGQNYSATVVIDHGDGTIIVQWSDGNSTNHVLPSSQVFKNGVACSSMESLSFTCGGSGNGAPCIFPFKYKGETHTTCTNADASDMWCATSYLNGTTDVKDWGLCNCPPRYTIEGCPCKRSWSLTPSSSPCTSSCCNPDQSPTDWCIVEDQHCQQNNWGHCASLTEPSPISFSLVGHGRCASSTCDGLPNCSWLSKSGCKTFEQCKRSCHGFCAGFAWTPNATDSEGVFVNGLSHWEALDDCQIQGLPRCITYWGDVATHTLRNSAQDYMCYAAEWQQACHDSNWRDLEGRTCSEYTSKQFCNSSGLGPNWQNIPYSVWEPKEKYAVTAEQACCGCGGGMPQELSLTNIYAQPATATTVIDPTQEAEKVSRLILSLDELHVLIFAGPLMFLLFFWLPVWWCFLRGIYTSGFPNQASNSGSHHFLKFVARPRCRCLQKCMGECSSTCKANLSKLEHLCLKEFFRALCQLTSFLVLTYEGDLKFDDHGFIRKYLLVINISCTSVFMLELIVAAFLDAKFFNTFLLGALLAHLYMSTSQVLTQVVVVWSNATTAKVIALVASSLAFNLAIIQWTLEMCEVFDKKDKKNTPVKTKKDVPVNPPAPDHRTIDISTDATVKTTAPDHSTIGMPTDAARGSSSDSSVLMQWREDASV